MKQGRLSAIPTVMSLLAAFVAVSVVGGMLAAGLLIPVTALGGTVVKSGTALYDSLPTEFQAVVPQQQTEIVASDGKTVIATLYDENRVVVPLKAISPWMQKAQVAIEDHRFYQHAGVDLNGVGAAVGGALMGGQARGASTLTQQYVKVTLATAADYRGDAEARREATKVSAARKLQELKYAVEVEKRMTKEQILGNYLNLVYYGDKAYGVEAAARHYFRTTAAKLTIPQAATLAGVVQSPGANDPVHNPKAALARRNQVLTAMHRYGYIDAKQLADSKAAPLGVAPQSPSKSNCNASPYPFWCNYVTNYLETLPVFGSTPQERKGRVVRGGYRIVTTLDPDLQQRAGESLGRVISAKDYTVSGPKFGGAATTVEPSTGKIRAMVQSTGYNVTGRPTDGQTQVNWAADHRYGASGGFQVGSTMKLFSVVEAVKQGKGGDYVIRGIRKPRAPWQSWEFQEGCRPGSTWSPGNAEGDDPATQETIARATQNSVNTSFVALAHTIGTCNIRNTALAMGMHAAANPGKGESPDGKPLSTIPASLVLGATPASPETMAAMYGVVANGGVACPNTPIESVTDSDGKKVDLKLPGCKRVLDDKVAGDVAGIFQSVMTEGTGKPVQIGRPAMGKTGTDADNETWFAGATPQYATAVWVGTPDDNSGSWHHMRLHPAGGGSVYYPKAYGFKLPGPVWQGIMRAAHEGQKVIPFGSAPPTAAKGEGDAIPDVSGMSVREARKVLQDAGYEVAVGSRVPSNQPRGSVARTRPSGNAPKGSTITLRLSTGRGGARAGGTSDSQTGATPRNGNGG